MLAEDLPAELTVELRQRRKSLRLTLREVFEQAGVDLSYLSLVERGRRARSLAVLARLRMALGSGDLLWNRAPTTQLYDDANRPPATFPRIASSDESIRRLAGDFPTGRTPTVTVLLASIAAIPATRPEGVSAIGSVPKLIVQLRKDEMPDAIVIVEIDEELGDCGSTGELVHPTDLAGPFFCGKLEDSSQLASHGWIQRGNGCGHLLVEFFDVHTRSSTSARR